MQHFKAGSRPTKKATSDYFTGNVWQDPIVEAPEPARIRGLRVTFEPGANFGRELVFDRSGLQVAGSEGSSYQVVCVAPHTPAESAAYVLGRAPELILGSAGGGVRAVTQLDGQPVGDGNPGPVFRKLCAAWLATREEFSMECAE